jgi:3-oxoadipate enol-lactonase
METVKLFYREVGSGEPIIFIHGYPLDHSIWLPLVPGLENHARLILPDLRGHGQSPAPAGVYSMDLLAADILALMDDLGFPRAVLAGHSVGGYIALHFARNYPERLAGLALVASHCFADPPERKQIRLETAEKVEKTGKAGYITESMLPSLTPDKALQNKLRSIIEKAKPNGVAGILRGMAERSDTCDVLPKLNVPAVIIAGELDVHLSVEKAQQMADLMKKPWLEMIAGAGHTPMMEAPERVSEILISLMRKSFTKEHEMEKDPVCGMDVDPKNAAGKSDYQGKTYFFCSLGCKKEFDQFPDKYLKKTTKKDFEK